MNKLISLLFAAFFLISCNGNSGSGEKHDNNTVSGDTSQRGDTSSYERMPNKTSDTSQH